MSAGSEDFMSEVYFREEIDLAVSVAKSGLAILQKSSAFYHRQFQVMLLLSAAFERLMKTILCLRSLTDTGQFLSDRELRRFRHNLVDLKAEILNKCYTSEALRREAMREDRDFLSHDALINKMLEVFSDFAERERYVYMDAINNPMQFRGWLIDRWEEIERTSLPSETAVDQSLDDYIRCATQQIIICIERYLRALARITTISGLIEEASRLGTGLYDFLIIDSNLGQARYEV